MLQPLVHSPTRPPRRSASGVAGFPSCLPGKVPCNPSRVQLSRSSVSFNFWGSWMEGKGNTTPVYQSLTILGIGFGHPVVPYPRSFTRQWFYVSSTESSQIPYPPSRKICVSFPSLLTLPSWDRRSQAQPVSLSHTLFSRLCYNFYYNSSLLATVIQTSPASISPVEWCPHNGHWCCIQE